MVSMLPNGAESKPTLGSDVRAVRLQLERVLESSGFSRNERRSRFLRFVIERQLDGKDHELKESVIAVEVFGRSPDFDSRLDPVVRIEAVRLRARLGNFVILRILPCFVVIRG